MASNLVDDIKSRLSIEEVIGSYVSLKPAGASFKALSPFKSEKTPSLVVTPAKDIWKDFSSGKGGNMFGFIMEIEGVSYPEAINILARKANLDPQDYRSANYQKLTKERQQALRVLKFAAKHYQAALVKSAPARNYAQKRGLSATIRKEFQIGYAPRQYTFLTNKLKQQKVDLNEALSSGLIKQKDGRFYDLFANRLMLPLTDPQGEVIGFTGRDLNPKASGFKYINTPQTIVYNKSRHVFGFYQAKDAIRKAGHAVMVEGNLDVVSCHQAGFKNTVATAGTAVTFEQLKILKRFTDDVRLAFDGDEAGFNAMERAIATSQQAEVGLSVINLPPGKDPDDIIRVNPDDWRRILEDCQPVLDWLKDRYKRQFDMGKAASKKKLTDVMLVYIKHIRDPVVQEHYLKDLAGECDVSLESLVKKLKTVKTSEYNQYAPRAPAKKPRSVSEKPAVKPGPAPKRSKLPNVQLLLGYLIKNPNLLKLKDPDEITKLLDAGQKEFFEAWRAKDSASLESNRVYQESLATFDDYMKRHHAPQKDYEKNQEEVFTRIFDEISNQHKKIQANKEALAKFEEIDKLITKKK